MTSKTITPEYFTCVEGSSNKFYIICNTVDGTETMTGWGANKPSQGGQWKKISASKASKKRSDKTSSGYKPCQYTEVPWGAVEKLLQELCNSSPEAEIRHNGNGGFIIDDAAPAPATTAPARSPMSALGDRIRKKYHVWI